MAIQQRSGHARPARSKTMSGAARGLVGCGLLLYPLAACGPGGGGAPLDGSAYAADLPADTAEVRPPFGWLLYQDGEPASQGDRLVISYADDLGADLDLRVQGSTVAFDTTRVFAGDSFAVNAMFTVGNARDRHQEAVGLVVGGRVAADGAPRYTVFYVRSNGTVRVMIREGDQERSLSEGWVRAPSAYQPAQNDGVIPNRLSVHVRPDSTRFQVGGRTVFAAPTASTPVHGALGLAVQMPSPWIWDDLEVYARGWTAGTDSTHFAAAPQPRESFSVAGFYASSCAPCHGASGRADGPVSAGLNPSPAAFADPVFWSSRTDDHIASVIRDGGQTLGLSAQMPAWGDRITPDQTAQLVAYLRTFAQ